MIFRLIYTDVYMKYINYSWFTKSLWWDIATSLYKHRFIPGSSKCSTKPLSMSTREVGAIKCGSLRIQKSYYNISNLPLTNVKRHSDPWPTGLSTDQTFHQFHDLNTELDLHRIKSGFHWAFATVVASQQGTLTLPDTWSRPPFWDLLVLQLLRPDTSSLPCLYSTFHLKTTSHFLDFASFKKSNGRDIY